MSHWTDLDRRYMQRALDLARQGRGRVEPNPMVGCVVVRNKRIVGQGYHRRFGAPHAERNALREAGAAARGATLYVTLEPCCHAGKTPPCCDALIRADVRRVVVAIRDPNPLVAGRGLRKLRAAGIRIDLGLSRDAAKTLNAPFLTFHREGRPYVILKWAQSIDGKIATRGGDSKWITSRQSRAAAHALRGRVDAVIVGVNTVLADDPALTARRARPQRVAVRIALDPDLRTPPGAELVRTAQSIPTIIATSRRPTPEPGRPQSSEPGRPQSSEPGRPQSNEPGRPRPGGDDNADRAGKQRRLLRAGCEVLELPRSPSGLDLGALLRELRARDMTNVLVEGGGRVLGSFLQEHLADEAFVFVAPRLIGGEYAPGPLRHLGPALLGEAAEVMLLGVAHYGPDLCYNLGFGRARP